MKKQGRISLVMRFSKGTKKYFIIVLLASLASTILNSMIPRMFSFTIDRVLIDGGIPWLKAHLWVLALIIIGIALANGGSIYLYRNNTAKAGETFAKNMRDNLFIHVQRLPMKWHSENQTGDIIQRCTADVETIRNFVITQVLEVFRTVFLLVISLVMMFSMNVKLTFVALAFMPIIILYSGVFYQLIARNFTKADEAEGELSTVVQENATGVRVVRAFGREQFEIDRFDEKNEFFAKMWIRLGTLSGLYWAVGDIITGFQVIFIIVLGAVEAVHGNITAGEFIAFASYNTTLVWPIRSLGRILSEMSKTGVSFERVNYILDSEEEDYESRVLREKLDKESEAIPVKKSEKYEDFSEKRDMLTKAPSMRGIESEYMRKQNTTSKIPKNMSIDFDHVIFRYRKDHMILNDITFHMEDGKTYGILGGTGSGKSTLVALLDRLYELEEGTISIGGIDIHHIPRTWLRGHIGMVLQEPFLFSRTIRENIAATNPDATMEEIREAARIACVDEAIMSFPDGYETMVGERGVTLSGGQRQRVAIARMLLTKAPIMVFDDSLSAVDADTDAKIRKALRSKMKKATVIIISHRITTLMEADEILVFNHGELIESGTHAKLIHGDGVYQKIYEIQMNQDDRKLLEEGNTEPWEDQEIQMDQGIYKLPAGGGAEHE